MTSHDLIRRLRHPLSRDPADLLRLVAEAAAALAAARVASEQLHVRIAELEVQGEALKAQLHERRAHVAWLRARMKRHGQLTGNEA